MGIGKESVIHQEKVKNGIKLTFIYPSCAAYSNIGLVENKMQELNPIEPTTIEMIPIHRGKFAPTLMSFPAVKKGKSRRRSPNKRSYADLSQKRV